MGIPNLLHCLPLKVFVAFIHVYFIGYLTTGSKAMQGLAQSMKVRVRVHSKPHVTIPTKIVTTPPFTNEVAVLVTFSNQKQTETISTLPQHPSTLTEGSDTVFAFAPQAANCDGLDNELTGLSCFEATDPQTKARCHFLFTQCDVEQPDVADVEKQFPAPAPRCISVFVGQAKPRNQLGLRCFVLPSTKFFHESRLSGHLDARWGVSPLPSPKKENAVVALYSAWAIFTQERGLRHWLFAGSLIGWFFNKGILPWDDDLDVQVLASDLLSHDRYGKYDRTTYNGRYVFEINPNSAQRAPDQRNLIDARFIDMETGMFIDVVAVSYDSKTESLQCKRAERFNPRDIFPIRKTTFLGATAWVPSNVSQFLITKYGPNVTLHQQPQRHHTSHCPASGPCAVYFFNSSTLQWVDQRPSQAQ
eukprot:GGOE01012381.1.p1 GENE.GGOE01012381.1~~GGOE01012381.1.p1  ORF type:complete len:417 (-),score=71.94 GGOE01012381.1:1021-2271(-)